MDLSRRSFVGGALAAGVWGAAAGTAAPHMESRHLGGVGHDQRVPPRLRFGMMSDVHIGGKPDAVETTEKVLRWFASENVDAVLCAGDVAHSGLISELEKFAAVWYKVFPGGRAPDGRKVELMISTGNHDVDAWGGRWKNFTEAEMLAKRFCYKDNPEKTWQRLFGQKWEIIWRREVKGYTFIGSQWSSLKPPIEKYMKEHAQEFASSRPFFYCQHQAPKGTCHGSYSAALSGDDLGETVRALSPFPNAVAFSGHSHCAISDERTVWQGAFTSIGAGCIHEGSGGFGYANVTAAWHPSYRKKLMASLADPHPWGGDAKGGGCELVEVFDDHLVVHRRSVVFGLPLGPAFVVPLPARKDGPLDFARRAAAPVAPQFAPDATVTATFCPKGHALEGVSFKGKPCIYVSFPRAKTVNGSRVFDYTVEVADAQERIPPVVRKIVAPGFAYPEACADLPGECLFTPEELPVGKPVRLTVTPRDCFGRAGRPLVASTTIAT